MRCRIIRQGAMMKSSVLLLAAGLCGGLCAPALAQSRMLNDTGVRFCGGALDGNTDLPCTPAPPAQDVEYGADAASVAGVRYKVGAGNAGFDFSKIAHDGSLLPADAALGDGAGEWACIRDNTTGLWWEVKVDDVADVRHMDHTFTWYHPASPDGDDGAEGEVATCDDTLNGQACNSLNYVGAVNATMLCGYSDWRLPSPLELAGIVDHGRSGPAIDIEFFPNTVAAPYWTASQAPFLNTWVVLFGQGGEALGARDSPYRIRLVRGGG